MKTEKNSDSLTESTEVQKKKSVDELLKIIENESSCVEKNTAANELYEISDNESIIDH